MREYYDLGVLLPSLAASCLSLVFLPWALRENGAPGLPLHLAVFCTLAAWSAYCLPNLLLYPFEFSVGMDTIFETVFLDKVIGYLSALLLAFLTGWALYASAKKAPLRRTVLFAVLALLVMVIFQVLTIVQILLGRNLIPRTKWLTSAVIWGVNHGNGFLYTLIGLAFLFSLQTFQTFRVRTTEGANPAERRKKKSEARRQVHLVLSVFIGLLLSLLTMTVGQSCAGRGVELSPPLELPASEGQIVIPLESVNDGSLHRYVYKASDGTGVRYIIVRKSETAYGVGLDACDVCGASGYYQRKDQVVCILCDVVMNISTIGFPGGCNPVPLKHVISSGALVIETKDLESEKRRFR
ncbi:MAG: Fe-S-containing protein [Synergistaceae bacterium]|nr:Fe-S-containing protein [Synergistaceae bacterium]